MTAKKNPLTKILSQYSFIIVFIAIFIVYALTSSGLTWNGVMNMRNRKWADDFSPLDPEGTSFVDHQYSKAYLRHLFIAGEMFAAMIASEHNLAFYLDLVRTARQHIIAGDFAAWKDATVPKLMTRL